LFAEPNEDRLTQTKTKGQSLPAPVAPRRPHSFTTHGIHGGGQLCVAEGRQNGRKVLRDPSILNADIRQYLES